MKRLAPCGLLLIALLSWAAWSQPHPSLRVRLASWNLHNLFDEHDDPYDDQTPTPGQVEAKLSGLSAALRQMDADLVAVQEVENRALLERLARASGYRYAVLVEGNDQARGIDVGFLSRRVVSGYRSHKDDPLPYVEGNQLHTRYSRDCLEVHLSGLIVLVNHFKAKLGKTRTSASKRRAQAEGVRALVDQLQQRHPGWGLAVVGDLNDTPESWSLEPLTRSGLVDPFASLSLVQRYTLRHRKETVVLDHILLNSVLARLVAPGSARVHREWNRLSDHAAISVDLNYTR